MRKINLHHSTLKKEVMRLLKRGGLIIFPSDTVYGLLTDATNEEAVKKLIKFKNRPLGKPISVFVSDFLMLEKNVEVDNKQITVLKQLLPGPFTVILPSKHRVSPLLESEKGNLGVRIPNYQPITDLVKRFGKPLTATSANLSNKPPHYSVGSLQRELPKYKQQLIDLVVDAGKLPRNKPSTVVDLTAEKLKILRSGDIVVADVKTFISYSPKQTKKIAQFIFQKLLEKAKKKPLVFIIEGDLGVGKTIFIKGIGEFLGIKDIISPTFVVYYEYTTSHWPIQKLYHFDLYKIEEKEEFKHLEIENLLKPKNVLCFEWGEKTGEVFFLLKKKAGVIYIKMSYRGENKREILLHYINKL